MYQFHKLFRWSWSILVMFALAFAMAGCDGKDGAQGPQGPTGPPGADGADGADGPPGPQGESATVTPLESCGVCHNAGSFADATEYHKLDPIEFVDNIVIAPAGDDLTVSFRLARDGVLTAGYDTIQRGYRTDGTDRITIVDTLSALTDNGDGTYSFTITGGNLVAGDNRYLFRVAMGDDRETRVYFYKDYPFSPVGERAVSAAACNSCHGPEGIGVHGGYFQAEDGAEPCQVCHGKVGSRLYASLGEAAHAYHNNVWDPDEHITYPTYMTNCSVCHADPAQLAAVNEMPVGQGCFTCHGSMDYWAEYFTPAGHPEGKDLTIHFSLTPSPEEANCASCHNGVDGVAGNKLVVTDSHNGLTTERGGIIWDGVDTSVTEGAKFNWWISDIVDDGVNLAISWQATYEGNPVDPCNETLGPGAPTFHAATDGSGSGNLSMLRNYAQGDAFILGMSTSAPGQALSVNVTVDNTVCAGGIATTTIPVDDVDAERGIVALQGKPRTVSPDGSTTGQRVRSKTPTYEWMVGQGVDTFFIGFLF